MNLFNLTGTVGKVELISPFKGGFPRFAETTRLLAANIPRQLFFVKATSHSTIFDIPMRPLREDQKHRHRFTR